MKRERLENYIGKTVQITFYDKDVVVGELHKTREEQFINNPNLYLPDKCYFLINPQSCLFRCSHVVKIKEI